MSAPDTARPRRRRRRTPVGWWIANAVLILGGFVMLAPFLWAVSAALQPSGEAFALPPNWIPRHLTLDNAKQVFDFIPFGVQALNSIVVTTLIVVGSLAVSCLAAYPLARLEFRGRDAIFGVLL